MQAKLKMDDMPNGTNAVVAVISYTGYDMEDDIESAGRQPSNPLPLPAPRPSHIALRRSGNQARGTRDGRE